MPAPILSRSRPAAAAGEQAADGTASGYVPSQPARPPACPPDPSPEHQPLPLGPTAPAAPPARARRPGTPSAAGAAGGAAAGAAAEEDLSPPYVILEHLPLAVFTNGALHALNELRHCALLALARPLADLLQASLEQVASALVHYKHTHKLGPTELPLFRCAPGGSWRPGAAAPAGPAVWAAR
jgi:hypothetical protein